MYSNYYSDYYSSGLTSSQQAGLMAIFGAAMGIYLVIVLAVAVIQIIAMWKIFTKAGEEGWKSIIPIYNMVTLFKIIGLSPWLILGYFATIIPYIGPYIGWIVVIAITIIQAYYLAKSFGKEIGYMFGLWLLPSIFYMILGFGNAQYVGPYKKQA